jgi:hypothetical protein
MKFELPPPLPEKRASPSRPISVAQHEEPPKRSSQTGNGSAPAGHKNNGTPPPLPPLPPPENPPAARSFSPPKSNRISGAHVVVVAGLLVVPLIVVVSWIGAHPSPTRSAGVPLPSYVPDTTPSPTPPWMTDATPTPMPTISMWQELPPIYATPTPATNTPVMQASPIFHVVKVPSGDYLNIREGPGSNYQITGRIPPATDGISIIGTGVQNGNTLWVPIMIGQVRGWVSKDYLSSSGSQAQVSIAQGQNPLSSFDGERYPQTRLQLLTTDDLKSMSNAQLRYAINEVYARYGASFPNNPDV